VRSSNAWRTLPNTSKPYKRSRPPVEDQWTGAQPPACARCSSVDYSIRYPCLLQVPCRARHRPRRCNHNSWSVWAQPLSMDQAEPGLISNFSSMDRPTPDRDERYLLQVGIVVFFIRFALRGRNLLNGRSRRQQGSKILGVHFVKCLLIR
jgi:hypothetical protein